MDVKDIITDKKQLEEKIADLVIRFVEKYPFADMTITVDVMRGKSVGGGLITGDVNLGVEVKVKSII
jgi:hypothetical protein